MNINLSAKSELSTFSDYVDRIIERVNAGYDQKCDLSDLLDGSVEKTTNEIIVDLVKTDFSKFSNVRSSLKTRLLEANSKLSGSKSNKELVGV